MESKKKNRKINTNHLSRLRTDGGTLAGDGLETGLNTSDRASRPARLALQEEQPGVLLEDGFGRAAGVARHVLLDVPPQHVLDLLRLEAALDDELGVAVDGTARAQLGEQKVQQVLRLSMQRFADFGKVGKRRLLGAHAQHLGRSHHKLGLPASRHVRVLVQDDLEHPLEQLVVRVVPIGARPRRAVLD